MPVILRERSDRRIWEGGFGVQGSGFGVQMTERMVGEKCGLGPVVEATKAGE